jgi:hypothetical protein
MLQWLYTYVASICPQCFICFFSYVCCKCVYLNVTFVSHICCRCFYLDVAYVCNGFQLFFASVSDKYFECFICLFWMLQVLHWDVSKVDRVLHMDARGKREGAQAVPARATFRRRGASHGLGWCRRGRVTSRRHGPTRGRAKRRENQLQPWASVWTSGHWECLNYYWSICNNCAIDLFRCGNVCFLYLLYQNRGQPTTEILWNLKEPSHLCGPRFSDPSPATSPSSDALFPFPSGCCPSPIDASGQLEVWNRSRRDTDSLHDSCIKKPSLN